MLISNREPHVLSSRPLQVFKGEKRGSRTLPEHIKQQSPVVSDDRKHKKNIYYYVTSSNPIVNERVEFI